MVSAEPGLPLVTAVGPVPTAGIEARNPCMGPAGVEAILRTRIQIVFGPARVCQCMGSMRARAAISSAPSCWSWRASWCWPRVLAGRQRQRRFVGRPTAGRTPRSRPRPRRSRRCTTQRAELLGGGVRRVQGAAGRAEGPPGRREQVGVVVRAVPGRVPGLPEGRRPARQAGWRSWASTRATTRRRAKFLSKFPLTYPSYKDPDRHVAQVFNGVAAFPTTAFYDRGRQAVSTCTRGRT